MISLIDPLRPLDLAALALLVAAWIVVGRVIENPHLARPSVSVRMGAYRRDWMRNVVTRDPRVFDAIMLGNLRQGTAFFASTAMIALGGGLALIGNIDRLTEVTSDLPLQRAPAVVYEIKLIVVLLFVANAFLKFVWAHRVFGYCAVMLGAVPNDPDDPMALHRADQAADLNNSAATAFNRGLRSVYFALGALAWLLGAVALIAATLFTVVMLWRREFASATRASLAREPPSAGD